MFERAGDELWIYDDVTGTLSKPRHKGASHLNKGRRALQTRAQTASLFTRL